MKQVSLAGWLRNAAVELPVMDTYPAVTPGRRRATMKT
jgi:hypothetical protein